MKKEKIGFNLIGIRTDQFATFEKGFTEKEDFGLNIGIDFRINASDKQIAVFNSFEFEQKSGIVLKIEASCAFAIESEIWDECLNGNTITFPRGFISHLLMLTIGTTRGILHSKTEGTRFNQFVLPAINATELVKEDVEFELDKD